MSATVIFAAPKRSAASFSDQQIKQVAEGDPVSIANWVRITASERHVSLHRRPTDMFAQAVSRLSDAEIDLDSVEQLLVALGKARVITPFQRGLLQVNYLR